VDLLKRLDIGQAKLLRSGYVELWGIISEEIKEQFKMHLDMMAKLSEESMRTAPRRPRTTHAPPPWIFTGDSGVLYYIGEPPYRVLHN
jgi:hypothetical protein